MAISSKVLGADGTWHALDARPLYRMIVAASETYNTAFEAALTARLAVTFTARPDTRGGREPVREITGVPFAMIKFFSRRRAAIEGRYAQLVRGYRNEHGHDPSASAARQLAQQANLDTRPGKKPPRPLADKRAAWREELTARFGPGAVARLMKAVPSTPPVPVPDGLPVTVDLEDLAERTVAAVSARRSTWTVWNLHAEVERLLRTEVPVLAPERHRELAATVTALAVSPACSISVEAPARLDEPAGRVRGRRARRIRGALRHHAGHRAAGSCDLVRLRFAAAARRDRAGRVGQDDRDARPAAPRGRERRRAAPHRGAAGHTPAHDAVPVPRPGRGRRHAQAPPGTAPRSTGTAEMPMWRSTLL